jgi:N-acetylmuramoyl-L-alanine amidase
MPGGRWGVVLVALVAVSCTDETRRLAPEAHGTGAAPLVSPGGASRSTTVADTRAVDVVVWPQAGARTSSTAYVPRVRRRIAIDAGHGAPGNTGALSLTCAQEQDFTLRLARALIEQLEGRFDIVETRPPGRTPPYAERVAQAERAHVDALISLHFDARGSAVVRAVTADGRPCLESPGSTGFAILWSDEGPAERVARRRVLARAVAGAMAARGFAPYSGEDYPGLYAADLDTPGVFVDRHAPRQRVYMLRRPKVPVVIVETHQALHAEEWARWQEQGTVAALAEALAEAVDRAAVEGSGS